MAAELNNEARPVIGLWLELDVGSGPISGTIRVGDEAPKTFFGWLGLTAVLESARTEQPAVTPEAATHPDMLHMMTRTEREAVQLVCEGMTNPQIARRLGVSPRTVQGHLLKVFRKFDVSSRTELVARLLRAQISGVNAPSGSQESHSSSSTSNSTTATSHSDRDATT